TFNKSCRDKQKYYFQMKSFHCSYSNREIIGACAIVNRNNQGILVAYLFYLRYNREIFRYFLQLYTVEIKMPGTPMEPNRDTLQKLQTERPSNGNYQQVVREITQTDHLNKRLLVSLLERMNKSNGEFDSFMEKETNTSQDNDDSDF
ncbi:hypothetical protein V1477_010704, partial [Vespula maculifrons]